jgi:hypothetical protein
MVEPSGVEPLTSCVKAGALPTELWPHSDYLEEELLQHNNFLVNKLFYFY